MAEDPDAVHVSLPRSVFAIVLAAAVGGGAGLYGTVGPQLDKTAIGACIDNSDIALNVAAQHGQELQTLRNLIYERTADRYTAVDAKRFESETSRWHNRVESRLDRIERMLDK